MNSPDFQILHLADRLTPSETGKQSSTLLHNDEQAKVILFAFPPDEGLAEHVAPWSAIIQMISGEAEITVANENVSACAGTWIRMEPNVPHSILAKTPTLMLLTLLKSSNEPDVVQIIPQNTAL